MATNEEAARPGRGADGRKTASGLARGNVSTVDRAKLYLEKIPPAVAGNGGDEATYKAACALVRGFNLSDDHAHALLLEWGGACVPPWSPAELRSKVQSARANGRGEFGHLLGDRGNGTAHATARPAEFAPSESPPAVKPSTSWRPIWAAAKDLDDPAAAPGRAYLEARGLSAAFPLPTALRCHPALAYHDKEREIGHFPALVALVTGADGAPLTVHRIYVTEDGHKAPVAAPKKLCGPMPGGAVRLDEPEPDRPLVLAEGLENALAVRQATGWPTWSTVSASGMAAVKIPGDVREVVIACDLDRSKAGGEAAAKLAARLHAEGRVVRVAMPPGPIPEGAKGLDWLDVLNAAGAATVRQAMEAAEVWADHTARLAADSEDPIPLDIVTPPQLPAGLFPGAVGEMIEAVAAATETPRELAAGMALAVLATGCHGRWRVCPEHGYSEPLNLWTVTALDSGNRKSAVLTAMTVPLLEYDRRRAADAVSEIKRVKVLNENLDARLKAFRAQLAKAKAPEIAKIESQIDELEERREEEPTIPRTWADDITPENLGTVMAANEERLAILSDEGGLFEMMAGRYNGGVPNLDLYLKSHVGTATRVDRGSRPSVFMRSPALSIGLVPQPEVLRSLAAKPGFRGRGLLARFLYLLPPSPLGYRPLEAAPMPLGTGAAYDNVIAALLSRKPGVTNDGESLPHRLALSSKAHGEWKEFARAVEIDLRDGGRFERLHDWAGKLPGQAVRIAGLLHCAEHALAHPEEVEISEETMGRALELAAILSEHARAVFDLMGASTDLEGARKVWRWIERERGEAFSLRDCHQALRGTFPRVADIEPPFEMLLERHLLLEDQRAAASSGGRPSRRFRVHPMVAEGWR